MCVYNQIIAASSVAQGALVGGTVATQVWGIPVSEFSHLVVAVSAAITAMVAVVAFICREYRERHK